MVRHGFKYT